MTPEQNTQHMENVRQLELARAKHNLLVHLQHAVNELISAGHALVTIQHQAIREATEQKIKAVEKVDQFIKQCRESQGCTSQPTST